MPDQLAGCGIVITRPADQARSIADLITAQGGQPVLFPLLAIAPLEDEHPLQLALAQLPQCDWAIFISSNAVQHGMAAIRKFQPRLSEHLRFAAIGPATAAELQRNGIDNVLTPVERYDSESLLALPQMQQMQGQRVMIFRGVGGRELLAEQLQAHGAEIRLAECYRRINPQQDAGELFRLWQNRQLQAIVITSSEALRHLLALAGDAAWLRETLICVNHPRIAELAHSHGLKVAIAEEQGDAGMLNCLIRNTGHP